MKQLSVALLAAAASASSDFHPIVDQVNKAKAGWTAEVPTRFGSMSDVAKLCGTFLPGHPQYQEHTFPESQLEVLKDLPDSFDARTAFKQCPVIALVRDQSACGSCWAFGSTETFEGRHCVATGTNVERSTEDTVSCCNFLNGCFSMGCSGGQPAYALDWMASTGVVTGGDYGDKSTCRPYTMAPCAHHVNSTKYGPCPSSDYPTPSCSKQCQDGYGTAYSDDKQNGGKVSQVSGVDQIKTALQNGPLSVTMTVYSDFPTYKSGVYKHTSGTELGGHAVLMVGYGTLDGTDYWLVKNSWNEEWGDGGFFKIAHGDCGIDSSVYAIDF